MIKTLARSIKQEKENFRIPHSVQDVIPIRRIWLDGIFQAGNAYSRSYRLTDINYAIASKADKTAMLLETIQSYSMRWIPGHALRSPSTTGVWTAGSLNRNC